MWAKGNAETTFLGFLGPGDSVPRPFERFRTLRGPPHWLIDISFGNSTIDFLRIFTLSSVLCKVLEIFGKFLLSHLWFHCVQTGEYISKKILQHFFREISKIFKNK